MTACTFLLPCTLTNLYASNKKQTNTKLIIFQRFLNKSRQYLYFNLLIDYINLRLSHVLSNPPISSVQTYILPIKLLFVLI